MRGGRAPNSGISMVVGDGKPFRPRLALLASLGSRRRAFPEHGEVLRGAFHIRSASRVAGVEIVKLCRGRRYLRSEDHRQDHDPLHSAPSRIIPTVPRTSPETAPQSNTPCDNAGWACRQVCSRSALLTRARSSSSASTDETNNSHPVCRFPLHTQYDFATTGHRPITVGERR